MHVHVAAPLLLYVDTACRSDHVAIDETTPLTIDCGLCPLLFTVWWSTLSRSLQYVCLLAYMISNAEFLGGFSAGIQLIICANASASMCLT